MNRDRLSSPRLASAGRLGWLRARAAFAAALWATAAAPAIAQISDASVLSARDAWRQRDRPALAAARQAADASTHLLAPWVGYWDLNARLGDATPEELEAFFARYPDTYAEDRLRNDWLLELGRRRDWNRFSQAYPAFRMRDDPQVACYALLTRHLRGENVRDEAVASWNDQRDADDGCNLLATALRDARLIGADDIWRRMRLAVEVNRPRLAQQLAVLLGGSVGAPISRTVSETLDNPSRALSRHRRSMGSGGAELATLALIKLAASDPQAAADQMEGGGWQPLLPKEAAAWVWASIGRQAAFKLQDQAPVYFERAWALRSNQTPPGWADETLAWQARAALRAATTEGAERNTILLRWRQVLQAIGTMSPNQQREDAWQYWRARALLALPPEPLPAPARVGAVAPASSPAEAASAPPAPTLTTHDEARALLNAVASPLSFYGQLAAEDLGRTATVPARPATLSADERARARSNPGLMRALKLFELGLRSEAVREWNYTLSFSRPGGLPDRDLLAAAQLACDAEIWDRCINTSDRTREAVDLRQRFPQPYAKQLQAAAREARLDPAYLFGLIRQESRFLPAARSHVGASGLMQVMPATAAWTAKKLAIDYSPDTLTDPQTNIRIGVGYLKLVLDSFGGAQALAAAAYNAGPGRPRRWREGPTVDAAAWVENVPFSETRDYVKKVLGNAVLYSALMHDKSLSVRTRLGARIGPSEPVAPAADTTLP